MMDTSLTADEKRSLQMWFRQAIVEIEKNEACEQLKRWHSGEDSAPRHHHTPVGIRRARRGTRTNHVREFA
jgi:hypothetical protein